MPVYLDKNLTYQSSAERDNQEFGIVPHILTQSLHGVDELGDDNTSKKAKQLIDQFEKANIERQKMIFFVDEVDDASHTTKSREIFTPIINHYKKWAVREYSYDEWHTHTPW